MLDHYTLIKEILLLWGEMTYQSITLCTTQAQHYCNTSTTFKQHCAMLALCIFGLHKSPDIWAKQCVA